MVLGRREKGYQGSALPTLTRMRSLPIHSERSLWARDNYCCGRSVNPFWTQFSILETCYTFPGAQFIKYVLKIHKACELTDKNIRGTACPRSTACTSQSPATSSTLGPTSWRSFCLPHWLLHLQTMQISERVCRGV